MIIWLAVVLVGTGLAGLVGKLPGVEPAPYILRFNEDRPNPLYRRICYTFAWSEVVSLRRAQLRRAHRRDPSRHLAHAAHLRRVVSADRRRRAGRWARWVCCRASGDRRNGEGHERRYFYGSVWAVCIAQPVLWLLWKVLPLTRTFDVAQARDLLGRARLRRQPRPPWAASADAADTAGRECGRGLEPGRSAGSTGSAGSRVHVDAASDRSLSNPPNPPNPPNQCEIAFPLVRDRFFAFVTEQFPFAATAALSAFDRVVKSAPANARAIDGVRAPLARALRSAVTWPAGDESIETTPGVSVKARRSQSVDELVAAMRRVSRPRGHRREPERRRAARDPARHDPDARRRHPAEGVLHRIGSPVRRRRRFRARASDRSARKRSTRPRFGSVAAHVARATTARGRATSSAPIIRDVGAALAMRPEPATVRMVLNAQMGKAGPPMDGRDLHIGDFDWGIVPATAPLSISSLTVAGMGAGVQRARSAARRRVVHRRGRVVARRVARGDQHVRRAAAAGRSSACRTTRRRSRRRSRDQSAVRVFADKAAGYGIPGLTIDGTDPDAIAAAFAWAADRARAGQGPALIELVAMRMCGHAHHDDMLYLGKDPQPSWDYPPLTPQGYADPELYEFWRARDPIPAYAKRLESRGLLKRGDLARLEARGRRDGRGRGAGRDCRAVAGARDRDARRDRERSGRSRARVEILDRDDRTPSAVAAAADSKTRRRSTRRARRFSKR